MMLRLLRLSLLGHWPLLVGSWVALTVLLASWRPYEVWLGVDDETLLLIEWAWAGTGVLFGLFAHVFEQLPAHREYALHRGLGRRAFFAARASAGLVALVVPCVGSILAAAAVHAMGQDAVLLSGEGVARTIAIGSSAVAGFGLGAWWTTLRGRPLGVALLCVVTGGAFAGMLLVLVLPADPSHVPGVARYVLAQIALGVFLLLAASANSLRAHDPDVPVPLRAQAWNALVLAGALGFFAYTAVPSVQRVLFVLGSGLPWIVERADGAFGLADVHPEARGSQVLLDERHRPIQEAHVLRPVFAPSGTTMSAEPGAAARPDAAPLPPMKGDARLGVGVRSLLFHPFEHLLLEQPSGRLTYVREGLPRSLAVEGGTLDAVRRILERPDGLPFGSHVTVVGAATSLGRNDFEGDHGPLLLGDLDDGTLWRVAFRAEPPQVARVPLPRNDRFVGWQWEAAAHDRVLAAGMLPRRALDGEMDAVIVLGERGRSRFEGEELVPTAAEFAPPTRSGPTEVRVTPGADPFHARVEVLDRAGVPVFVHEYAPRRPRERLVHAVCVGLSLLRPAVLQAAPVPGAHARAMTRGFARPSFAWSVGLVLATLAVLRLRRLGASSARALFYAVLALGFGPAGFLAQLVLERRPAYARPVASQRPGLPVVLEPAA